MKQNLFAMLVGITPFLFSCQKEQLPGNNPGESVAIKSTIPASQGTSANRMNCEPFPFAMMAMDGGALTSYNMDITGNMGFSKFVNSSTNTNLNVNGACFVHTEAGNILFPANYLPALGLQSNMNVDWKLDESNENAITLSANYAALVPDFTFGTISSNKTIYSTCTATSMPNTIVNISSLNLNDERLTLVGAPSSDDGFIINVPGNFTCKDCEIRLTNVRPERVLFNITNASSVQVKSGSKFKGTILAPLGTVTTTNPDSFEGSIIAKTIHAIKYGYSGGGCGGSGSSSNFIQKTYCNGYQW